ncbi:22085_t:CDS:1, partial [Gigaspora rosea]
MSSPPLISRYSLLETPTDQYAAFNILTSAWRRIGEHGHPYFFLTGSAGTGKSYLITLIINHLKSHRKKYLLMAPTGVAAQNIDGKTIHSQLKIRPSAGNH